MKKILIINTIGLNYEGMTHVIKNYIRNMNTEGLQLEFVGFENINPDILNDFSQYGTVHILPHRKKSTKAYIKELKNLLKQNNYDIVHIHGNSSTMIIDVRTAKKCRIPCVIIHSHNTTCDHKFLHKVLRAPMLRMVSDRLACGRDAGRWMYGKKSFVVLNNAIDLEKFRFDEKIRRKVRESLKINDETIVIGHAGHFSRQKNHEFVLDVFNEFHKKHPDSVLMLVSDGPNFELIKNKAKEMGLSESVMFLGRRNDMVELYQAMDCFILPSLWEGLPLVLVEAQASGLPVLASDVITDEVKCTDHLQFLSLDKGAASWADCIDSLMDVVDRCELNYLQQMKSHGFSITAEAEKLREIYLK